jgi:diadenylate cyclase
LKNVTDGGVQLDAELSYDLLVSIFNTASPLHDGAVVVRRHRIAAASCFLPLTLNPRLSRDLGTRHRAAIGVTEDTDAVAVVVSEETGLISFVQRGEIRRGLDATRLREAILEVLGAGPKKEQKHSESESEAEEIASLN